MDLIKPSSHDIIFIGSGISCTAVLLQILDKLENLQNVNPLNIAVIEKNAEFWKGIPYGSRSSVNSLTITNLGEFVPNVEKEQFITWLIKNQDHWISELKAKGEATASKWLKNNLQAINSGQWDEIYIPRYLFGEYLKEKVDAEIGKARKNNRARITYIQGLAVDINRDDHCSYQVAVKDSSGLEVRLQAEKVILCIGSPPIKSIQERSGDYTYINDMYDPTLPHNFEIIQSVLSSVAVEKDRNVLILGSNASSLELLYLINTTPQLKDRVNKIVVISRSGSLPNRINADQAIGYEFENMMLLKNQKLFSSEDLMDAIENDISVARSKGINIADIYYRLSDLIVELLEMLENAEKEKFHCFYGAEFSKIIRRAGAEYRDAATELERSGKLEMLKGSFLRIKNRPGAGKAGQVEYQGYNSNEGITFPLSFPLIINCGGFETLNSYTSSELISGLIGKKLCETNCTGRGFKVDERFQAADGLYVMGPLLGGIFNNKTKLWHVENAKSIFYLANLMVSEMTLGGINKMIIRNN